MIMETSRYCVVWTFILCLLRVIYLCHQAEKRVIGKLKRTWKWEGLSCTCPGIVLCGHRYMYIAF
jgi:hypothetical protein